MVGKGTITMRETRILEFKETITNTFLKTVCAFSNYNGGTILFGVDDNGNVKGLPDVKNALVRLGYSYDIIKEVLADIKQEYGDE